MKKLFRTRTIVPVLFAGVLVPALAALPATAAQTGYTAFNISSSSVPAGGQITVSDQDPEDGGWDDLVVISFESNVAEPPAGGSWWGGAVDMGRCGNQLISQVEVPANSNWSATISIPANTPPGEGYQIGVKAVTLDENGNVDSYGDLGCASITVTPFAEAAPAPAPTPDGLIGTVETDTGGVALPGGGDSVAPGGIFRARITAAPGEDVTITVTLPGTPAPGIEVAGMASRTVSTNADGNAFFNIRVPRGTPAGIGYVTGFNASGAEIFASEFIIAGRAIHPAAG